MAKNNETEIAAVVVDWLESQDWDVYQEVAFDLVGNTADIVAVKGGKLWVVETKTSLNFQVLAQAERWKCHFRSVGVPFAKRNDGRQLAYRVCKAYLGIGILLVDPVSCNLTEELEPELQTGSDPNSQWMIKQLIPLHKTFAIAGSRGGAALTPYKQTMLKVREFIEKNPRCTLNDIIEYVGKAHYSSEKSAKNAIGNALSHWEKNWCIMVLDNQRGRWGYSVNPQDS